MRALVVVASLGLLFTACAEEEFQDHEHEGEDDGVGISTSALVATDTVGQAVADPSCSTNLVRGLSDQLIAEVECLRPNTMSRIDKIPNLVLRLNAYPFMQTSAADALKKVVAARGGVTLSVNSSTRTLPQQLMLYRWYQQKRCGISLAARPGSSNHESGTAVDVQDNAAWRAAFTGNTFRWMGSADPVHYDYIGGGTADLKGLSVRAFQRLWNRNHPEDKIAEDGAYGPATEARLTAAPIGGFVQGAKCDEKPDAAATPVDAGAVVEDPDAAPMPAAQSTSEGEEHIDEDGSNLEPGCGIGRHRSSGRALLASFLAIVAFFAIRRRHRAATGSSSS